MNDHRQKICDIISEMLDNPDEYGIFPTTIAYDKLEEYIKSIERKTKIENRIMELRAQEYICLVHILGN